MAVRAPPRPSRRAAGARIRAALPRPARGPSLVHANVRSRPATAHDASTSGLRVRNAKAMSVFRSTSFGHARANANARANRTGRRVSGTPGRFGRNAASAGIDHQCARCMQRFDFVQAQFLLFAAPVRRRAAGQSSAARACATSATTQARRSGRACCARANAARASPLRRDRTANSAAASSATATTEAETLRESIFGSVAAASSSWPSSNARRVAIRRACKALR